MSKPQLKLIEAQLNSVFDLGLNLNDASLELSKVLVCEAHYQARGNQTEAALKLGINRGVFARILKNTPLNPTNLLMLDSANIREIVACGGVYIHNNAVSEFKKEYIKVALIKHRGNQSAVARKLDCTRNTVKKYLNQ